MKKGGYQILDFSNYVFTDNVTVEGEFDEMFYLINDTAKFIIISGLTVGNKTYKDFVIIDYRYLYDEVDQVGTYILSGNNIEIELNSDGDLTVNENKNNSFTTLDLDATDFTLSSEETIDGIYDKIEGSDNVIIIKNFSIGSTESKPAIVYFTVSGTSYVGTFGIYTITIADDDGVTIAAT